RYCWLKYDKLGEYPLIIKLRLTSKSSPIRFHVTAIEVTAQAVWSNSCRENSHK
ncbi:MAG: hypothetical protein ACI9HK_005396, partial [Pirellulaceae bacterium]